MFFTTVSNCFEQFGKMKRNSFDNNLHKAESYLKVKELATSVKLNDSENIYNFFLQSVTKSKSVISHIDVCELCR